jgi:hypothetical protein
MQARSIHYTKGFFELALSSYIILTPFVEEITSQKHFNIVRDLFTSKPLQ